MFVCVLVERMPNRLKPETAATSRQGDIEKQQQHHQPPSRGLSVQPVSRTPQSTTSSSNLSNKMSVSNSTLSSTNETSLYRSNLYLNKDAVKPTGNKTNSKHHFYTMENSPPSSSSKSGGAGDLTGSRQRFASFNSLPLDYNNNVRPHLEPASAPSPQNLSQSDLNQIPVNFSKLNDLNRLSLRGTNKSAENTLKPSLSNTTLNVEGFLLL